MIQKAVLPALEDDIVSDVSVHEGREAILVSGGGDLDGVGNDKGRLFFGDGFNALERNRQLKHSVCMCVCVCV